MVGVKHRQTGWQGPIGSGTVKIRLPYEVNESNAELDGREPHQCQPDPDAFFVSGPEIVWSFVDLEPAEDDNICLTVLAVPTWDEITAAQRDVADHPESPQAHLRLARAAFDATFVNRTTDPWVPHSAAFVELAEQSHLRALELALRDAEVVVGCLQVVHSLWQYTEPVPEPLLELLDEAAVLAPDDERVLQIQEHVELLQAWRQSFHPRPVRRQRPLSRLRRSQTGECGIRSAAWRWQLSPSPSIGWAEAIAEAGRGCTTIDGRSAPVWSGRCRPFGGGDCWEKLKSGLL